LIEFNLPASVKGSLDDEETTPLDAEASTLDHEGDESRSAEGNDHDEDPEF